MKRLVEAVRSAVGVGATTAILMLLGCASLPEPAGPADTLLVIQHRAELHGGATSSDYFVLEVSGNYMKERRYTFSFQDKLIYVQGLAPGTYTLSIEHFGSDGIKKGPKKQSRSSAVVAGQMVVNERESYVDLSADRLRYGFRRVRVSDRNRIYSRLRDHENYVFWRNLNEKPGPSDAGAAAASVTPDSDADAADEPTLAIPTLVHPTLRSNTDLRIVINLIDSNGTPASTTVDPKDQLVVFPSVAGDRSYLLTARVRGVQGKPPTEARRRISMELRPGGLNVIEYAFVLMPDSDAVSADWHLMSEALSTSIQEDVSGKHPGGSDTLELAIGSWTDRVRASFPDPPTHSQARSSSEHTGGDGSESGASDDEVRQQLVGGIELPKTEPAIVYRDGKRYWGELRNGLVPDGLGTLAFPDGGIYKGGFRGGLFHGQGILSYPKGGVYKGRFEEGVPTSDGEVVFDGDALAEISPEAEELVREVRDKRAELAEAAMSTGADSGDLEDLVRQLRTVEARVSEVIDVEALFSRVGIDADVSFSSTDGFSSTIRLSSSEDTRVIAETFTERTETATDLTVDSKTVGLERKSETTATDASGDVVKVETQTTEASVSETTIGIEHREELRERRYEPVSALAFGTWGIDYSGSFSGVYSVHDVLAQFGFRSVSRGDPFPGPEGGSKAGFDFRIDAGAGMSIYDGEPLLMLNGKLGIGYSRVTFEPLNEADLTQKGKGVTFGVAAGATILPGEGMVLPDIAPLLSFDRYTYNPSTAKYRSVYYRFFIWPFPFVLSLGIGGSF